MKDHKRYIKSLLAVCASSLLFYGCASHTPVAVCPPIRVYPPEFSERLANELEAMPSDSAAVEAIGDYIGLRDALKACQ